MSSSDLVMPEPVRAVHGAQMVNRRPGRCIRPRDLKTVLPIRTMGFGIFGVTHPGGVMMLLLRSIESGSVST
jgi:hypothetical protein